MQRHKDLDTLERENGAEPLVGKECTLLGHCSRAKEQSGPANCSIVAENLEGCNNPLSRETRLGYGRASDFCYAWANGWAFGRAIAAENRPLNPVERHALCSARRAARTVVSCLLIQGDSPPGPRYFLLNAKPGSAGLLPASLKVNRLASYRDDLTDHGGIAALFQMRNPSATD